MGCCIFAVMIIAQVLETVRGARRFFRAPVKTTVASTPMVISVLHRFLERPMGKAVLLIALSLEAGAAASWLMIEHRDHVVEAVGVVEHWVGLRAQPLVIMCRAKTAA